MTSYAKARPLLSIAAIAALAVGVAACNSGGSSAQSGNAPANPGYSNSGYNPNTGPNGNESSSLYWQNQAQQNGSSAINDMGPGGAADPNDDGNSVSYSGGGN